MGWCWPPAGWFTDAAAYLRASVHHISSHFHWLEEFLAVCLSLYKYWASLIRIQQTTGRRTSLDRNNWRLEICFWIELSAIKVSDLFNLRYLEHFSSCEAFFVVLTVSRREHKAHGEIIEEAFFKKKKNFAPDGRLGRKEALDRLMTGRWSSRHFR